MVSDIEPSKFSVVRRDSLNMAANIKCCKINEMKDLSEYLPSHDNVDPVIHIAMMQMISNMLLLIGSLHFVLSCAEVEFIPPQHCTVQKFYVDMYGTTYSVCCTRTIEQKWEMSQFCFLIAIIESLAGWLLFSCGIT